MEEEGEVVVVEGRAVADAAIPRRRFCSGVHGECSRVRGGLLMAQAGLGLSCIVLGLGRLLCVIR